MSLLTVEKLTKCYGDHQEPVVNNVNFSVEKGELFALLGPSGCGKTTTLRLLAGLETPDSGVIHLQTNEISKKPTQQRGIGFVFQDYALFPHMSVAENIRFGLHKLSNTQQKQRCDKLLAMVKLSDYAQAFPHQLSGGQQQRVAIARALAPKPDLILLDEPFSNLDTALRDQTRNEICSLLRKTQTSAILVTHDQEEALSFADRIAIMQKGSLVQIDIPETIYQSPKTAFVAKFLGQTNFLTVNADNLIAQSALGEIKLSKPAKGETLISLRPEHISFVDHEHNNALQGIINNKEYKGHDIIYHVMIGEKIYRVLSSHETLLSIGDTATVTVTGTGVVLDN